MKNHSNWNWESQEKFGKWGKAQGYRLRHSQVSRMKQNHWCTLGRCDRYRDENTNNRTTITPCSSTWILILFNLLFALFELVENNPLQLFSFDFLFFSLKETYMYILQSWTKLIMFYFGSLLTLEHWTLFKSNLKTTCKTRKKYYLWHVQ